MKILLYTLLALILFSRSEAQLPDQRISKEEYIEKYKEIAIEQMNLYSIPASITLAQGILESGNGNSLLATEANNHFGIKCHKEWNGPTYHMDDDEANECFRRYENPDESYRDHSLFLTTRPRYSFLFELDISDYTGWAHGLKTAGYATNPNYANLLIKNIEEFELYKADPNHRQNLIAAKETVPNNINSSDEDFEGIVLYTGNRKVYKHNGVRFIYAKSGDTFKSIAADTEIAEWQLRKYNDLKKKDKLTGGQVIYVQAKKNKARESFHIVQPGETLYGISQQHAIRLKKLCQYNTLERDAILYPDQKIKLR